MVQYIGLSLDNCCSAMGQIFHLYVTPNSVPVMQEMGTFSSQLERCYIFSFRFIPLDHALDRYLIVKLLFAISAMLRTLALIHHGNYIIQEMWIFSSQLETVIL